jgi:hypothetical protein
MESDNAVIALSWRRSSEVRNPSKREQKKNPFPWRFACILVAAWEGQVHTLNFIYSASRVDWLMYRAPSAKKYIRSLFFLMTKFPSFRSTAAIRYLSETESVTGSFSR